MLQFLCLQMCVYGGGAVPQGGVGDCHLATVPQGVVGDRLPWGGERQGGGGGVLLELNGTLFSRFFQHNMKLQEHIGLQNVVLYSSPL